METHGVYFKEFKRLWGNLQRRFFVLAYKRTPSYTSR